MLRLRNFLNRLVSSRLGKLLLIIVLLVGVGLIAVEINNIQDIRNRASGPLTPPDPTPGVSVTPTPQAYKNSAPIIATTWTPNFAVNVVGQAVFVGYDNNLEDTLNATITNIPAGLVLDPCIESVEGVRKKITCRVSGKALTPGISNVSLTIADDKGNYVKNIFSIAVNDSNLTITSGDLFNGVKGKNYYGIMVGSSANPTDNITMTIDNKPAWLSMSCVDSVDSYNRKFHTCKFAGIPPEIATYTLNIKVSNGVGELYAKKKLQIL